MKKDIHPAYYPNAKAICACGNTFTTGSTQEELKIELCSACHPFYTGKQKLMDTSRRVEKFQARMEAKEKFSTVRKGKKAKRIARAVVKAKSSAKTAVKKTAKKTGKK